jgi:uncharacterized protein (DUF983 family)
MTTIQANASSHTSKSPAGNGAVSVGTGEIGAQQSAPDLLLGLRRGIHRRCPACGQGPLFRGYLEVRSVCPICANDNAQYPSDDFAPYITIFLVLHLMIPILIVADRAWQPSVWIEMVVAMPIFLLATLVLLPFVKGGVIGFAWAFGVVRRNT